MIARVKIADCRDATTSLNLSDAVFQFFKACENPHKRSSHRRGARLAAVGLTRSSRWYKNDYDFISLTMLFQRKL